MNNLRMLTGGLVLIVLVLAGGTGYLIYDRIQNEVAGTEKVTKQEVETIKTDVSTLKDSDKVQSAKISVLETNMAEAQQEIGVLKNRADNAEKVLEKLKAEKAEKADLDRAQAEVDGMKTELKAQQGKIDQIEKGLAAATKERAEIRKQLEAQGEKIDAQEKRVTELEKKGDARDEEIARLRAEIEEINRLLGRKPVPEN